MNGGIDMKKFIVEGAFWEIFPEAKIGIVICEDIDNSIEDVEKFKELLLQAEGKALNFLSKEEFSSNNVIQI
jgi:DNA/RNA-binding domain of Phe-tRNA-synthetase-like protein